MKSIRTRVVHSESKSAWNVVGTTFGGKYKIARVPYFLCDDEIIATQNKNEALEHAEFISHSFNNRESSNENNTRV